MPATGSAARTRLTVSVPVEVARYLRSTPNASAVVCEAVEAYRARELERCLEKAYREDAVEAERISREWERVDAEERGACDPAGGRP